jgi:predicted Zn-ribbon and HTH transcriptional regulator
MKKTRRLSIEYRHREVTITIEGSTLHVQDSEPEAAHAPAACPTCGSPWITMVAPAVADMPDGVDRIRRALQQSGLHLQVSPAGQLRICQRSFEELKEKL